MSSNEVHARVLDLGKFHIPFLILATGLLINATNYIDGSDGLLLTFFICCLGYYIFLIDDTQTISLIKLLLIPVILNLILNFELRYSFFHPIPFDKAVSDHS